MATYHYQHQLQLQRQHRYYDDSVDYAPVNFSSGYDSLDDSGRCSPLDLSRELLHNHGSDALRTCNLNYESPQYQVSIRLGCMELNIAADLIVQYILISRLRNVYNFM